eukprot:5075779-Prymnesium_polylepis.2
MTCHEHVQHRTDRHEHDMGERVGEGGHELGGGSTTYLRADGTRSAHGAVVGDGNRYDSFLQSSNNLSGLKACEGKRASVE